MGPPGTLQGQAGQCCYVEQIYGVVWGGRLMPYVRISEMVKEVENGLKRVVQLPPTALVMYGPGVLMGPKSEFIALMQPRSVMMSMAPDTSKG